jgi:HEAT repeat protein
VASAVAAALADETRRDQVVRVLADLDTAGPDGPLGLGALEPAGADPAALEPVRAAVARAVADPVAALTGHRDVEVRALALSVCAKIGGASASPRLVAGLGDDALEVRLAALGAAHQLLGRPGAAAPELVAAVARRAGAPSFGERSAAVHALGAAADGSPALIAALADGSGFVREAAARALAEHRHPEAVDALLTASHDEAAPVRAAAARALAALRGPSADPRVAARLSELAASDADADVRAAAAPP